MSYYFISALLSITSLTATFLVSNGDFSYATKVTVFISIIVFNLLLYAGIYVRQRSRLHISETETAVDSPFNAEVEGKLLALEQANEFFGASLKSVDMFRLISSRIKEIVPYTNCALYLADEKKEKLKIASAVGESFKKIIGTEIDSHIGLAGKTFQTRQAQIEERFIQDENSCLAEASKILNSAVAVPLWNSDDVFGVFVLYGERENEFNLNSLQLLEAVGMRIAPLFLSSRAFENNLTNALTDALTNLPNERAFYLVLENQIAESQRYREKRPLTIVAIDVKNFTEHNQRFGHATGDRLLLFASDKIKKQLRQMDFLARSMGDEFLAVLPTATEEIAREIVERIEKTLVANPFEVRTREKIHLQLNFGVASFGKDGEAAGQLLKHAILQKYQSKSDERNNKILWFPKEYVN